MLRSYLFILIESTKCFFCLLSLQCLVSTPTIILVTFRLYRSLVLSARCSIMNIFACLCPWSFLYQTLRDSLCTHSLLRVPIFLLVTLHESLGPTRVFFGYSIFFFSFLWNLLYSSHSVRFQSFHSRVPLLSCDVASKKFRISLELIFSAVLYCSYIYVNHCGMYSKVNQDFCSASYFIHSDDSLSIFEFYMY